MDLSWNLQECAAKPPTSESASTKQVFMWGASEAGTSQGPSNNYLSYNLELELNSSEGKNKTQKLTYLHLYLDEVEPVENPRLD